MWRAKKKVDWTEIRIDLSVPVNMEIEQLQHIRRGIVDGKCNVIASIIGRHTGGCDTVAGDYQSLYQQSIPW